MHNHRAVLAYDGMPFRGFARQPGVATVQGKIEDSLARVIGEETPTSAAGRTDAGVHALGQVISFRTTREPPDLADLRRRLNSMCSPTIVFLELGPAAEGFDARFSAISRSYEYGVFTREEIDPFSRYTTWHHPRPLDPEAMAKAALALEGEHDFSSFGRVDEGKSPVRHVESIVVTSQGDLIVISVTATSFIRQMVRSIAGTLVHVGEGKMEPEAIDSVLTARDRSAAGPVAPPHGLFLTSVAYPEDLL